MSVDINALLNALPDALLLVNERGYVEAVNSACECLFGAPSSEFQGQSIGEIFPSARAMAAADSLLSVLDREVETRKKDGSSIHALLTCRPLKDAQPLRFVCMLRLLPDAPTIDVRLLHVSRLATMGEMAAGIAHELNQPLTAIANYAQAGKWMLESKPLDQIELADALHEITTQALRAGNIIKRLRSLIQKGETQRVNVTMGELMTEIKALLITDARHSGVQLVLESPPDLSPVHVDRVQIQQVLLNLVRNSIDALQRVPRDQREVKVRSMQRSDGRIEICVIDSGPGVPADMRERMFLPFCAGEHGGAGLGLAVSRTIVEAHDGALGYRPNDNRGACFYFHLPAAKGSEA